MNYIQQAYKGDIGFWKYLIIPFLFLGFMTLNLIAVFMFDLDQNKLIKDSIEEYGENLFLIESLITFVFFLGVLFLWVKLVHKQSITSLTTSRDKIDWKRFWFAFAIWGSVTVLFVLIAYLIAPENLKWNFHPNKFLGLLLIGILLIPIQTSFEEYFFRGYLMQGLGAKLKSRWIPLIITSVIFGLLHIANPEVEKMGYLIMVYYIGTGFFLGIMTLMDEGLELALGFHAANNLITALLVTSNWTAFQTNSIFKDFSEPDLLTSVFLPVFGIFPIILFIFSKKYNWNNWSEKLAGRVEKPALLEHPIDMIGKENTPPNTTNDNTDIRL